MQTILHYHRYLLLWQSQDQCHCFPAAIFLSSTFMIHTISANINLRRTCHLAYINMNIDQRRSQQKIKRDTVNFISWKKLTSSYEKPTQLQD